ncbi:MAG: hypothetical protein QGM45_11695 [Anaerolineales bacterium]|nr:hypothetical protein [Anaerolineales bacterium]
MHGHVDPVAISGFLGWFYIALATMNYIMALFLWQRRQQGTLALVWLGVGTLFVGFSSLAFSVALGGNVAMLSWISIPESIRNFVDNRLATAVVYTSGTLTGLGLLFVLRRFFTKPMVAWSGINLAFVTLGFSMTDKNFAAIVTKPDNVPIVGLVFLLGFFTWLSAYQAVKNDIRIAAGKDPHEKDDNEKVLVWPDLVYIEMICMVAITAFLILWAIGLQAPLEEPASAVKTPNPSKAPWYFLGLQEMLVYFDPWMAGVVLPSVVLFGLMAIPYLDFNQDGNGYYTIDQRKFAYIIFQFGFLGLWITLIVLGTFLRGPNWNFFGPYEEWDPHKVVVLNNVDLSEYFWVWFMGSGRPKAPPNSNMITTIGYIIYREWVGIVLVLGYFIATPPIMAITVLRKFFVKMGFVRYMVLSNLLLIMMMLPIKMVLRWTCNMKYIIAIPEYFQNL